MSEKLLGDWVAARFADTNTMIELSVGDCSQTVTDVALTGYFEDDLGAGYDCAKALLRSTKPGLPGAGIVPVGRTMEGLPGQVTVQQVGLKTERALRWRIDYY